MGLFVSTTGTSVAIPELGITIVTPTTDKDMGAQFKSEEIANAPTLTAAIRAGTLVWRKVAAGAIQAPTNYDANFLEIEEEDTGLGAIPEQVATKAFVLAQGGKSYLYRMLAPQITSLATWTTLTDLVSVSLPVGKYSFDAHLVCQSANSQNGHGFRFNAGTATIINFIALTSLAKNPDSAINFMEQFVQRTLTQDTFTTVFPAANVDYFSVLDGTFEVTVAGTVLLQFRSEAGGVAITAQAKSLFEIRELQ